MSVEAKLCKEIIDEGFGSFASKVAEQLMLKGRQTLQELTKRTQYATRTVKEALVTLIQHGFVYFTEPVDERKENTVYQIEQQNILMRLRMGSILRITEEHYGKAGSSICQLLFLYGRVKQSQVKEWASNKHASHKLEATYVKAFTQMVMDEFITAVLPIHSRSSLDMAKDIEERMSNKYTVTTAADRRSIKLAAQVQANAALELEQIGMKRKLGKDTIGSEPKRHAQEDELPYDIDPTVFFSLNYEKYNMTFRNVILVDYATARINRTAGIVLKTFLRNAKDKMKRVKEETSPASTPNHIANMLNPEVFERGDIVLTADASDPKRKRTVAEIVESYVQLLKEDSAGFLVTKDQLGPNHYAVNFEKLRHTMRRRLFENTVTSRYGTETCRIVRVLLEKGKMDEVQIQKLCMIRVKDIRQKLEILLLAGIVEIQEIPRSLDRSTSRSFHLWYIPLERCLQSLLIDVYQTVLNIQQRKTEECKQRSRLLEKLNRKDVIADMNLLNEIDKAEVDSMNKTLQKIEATKSRLDEMIIVLRDI